MDIGRNDELAAHPGEHIDLSGFSTVPAPINALSPYASTMRECSAPIVGNSAGFQPRRTRVNHRANMRQRLVGRNAAQNAISGSLVCHCMSDAPYTSLKAVSPATAATSQPIA